MTENNNQMNAVESAMQSFVETQILATTDNNEPTTISNDDGTEKNIPEEIGGGIIIDTPKDNDKQGIRVSEVNADTAEGVQNALKEMDEEIIKAQNEIKAKQLEQEAAAAREEASNDSQNVSNNENGDVSKAVVIIDKFGMNNVHFSDEERNKLEKAKVIRIEETEDVSLSTIKVKKDKKIDVKDIINQKKNDGRVTNICLLASGYTATMGKASLYELSNFFLSKENNVEDQIATWSFIYSKIVDSSVKFLSFDHFVKCTAVMDYSTFIYGILCSTYPDMDEVNMTCNNEKCTGTPIGPDQVSHDYSFKYCPTQLIRTELINEQVCGRMADVIDNSYVAESANLVHQNSPVNTYKRYRLPYSGYIVEAGVESVHDFIYNASRSADVLGQESIYAQSLTTATLIRKLYIPDDSGEFYEIENKADIAEIIYNIPDNTDLKIILKQNNKLSENLSFQFGFINAQCPYCKQVTEYIPVQLEEILFHLYRQDTPTA